MPPSTVPCNLGSWPPSTVFRSYFSTCYGDCVNDSYQPCCEGRSSGVARRCLELALRCWRNVPTALRRSILTSMILTRLLHTPPHRVCYITIHRVNVLYMDFLWWNATELLLNYSPFNTAYKVDSHFGRAKLTRAVDSIYYLARHQTEFSGRTLPVEQLLLRYCE